MSDDIFVRGRQNCCRLCLAPDSECVPILTSLAADKEPLSMKIHACVNVKINQSDRLSLRICHSCISFMNSWQSFKNRCLAAQMKQLNWLEMAKNSMRRQTGQVHQTLQHSKSTSLTKITKHSTPNVSDERSAQNKPTTGRPMPIPFIIKEEPIDEEADAQEAAAMRMNFDPSEFLDGNIVPKQEVEDDDSLLEPSKMLNEEPNILTSLGLTQIKNLNQYMKPIPKPEIKHRSTEDQSSELPATQCRYCHIKFSSATNARRHERNLHRSTDMNVNETPKYCIKPTTPRSLLKPLQALRPNHLASTPLSSLKSTPPPVTPEMMGIYDYTKPEKYRHLLTDSKLLFIRKQEDFLVQYQNLTCACCPNTFPSYKTFMAHMRKKYPNLARNLCFKCLKQFQSKTTFVAHLKKRNCINLYKLYKADDNIPKTGPLPISPERVGPKELLYNKFYECKLCSKTFRLKLDFRGHVYEAHGDSIKKDVSPGRCGFCNLELEDPILRRRHYNNMECIVMIHCGTCQEKFELHQLFIDHVYDSHLASTAPSNNNDISAELLDESASEPAASNNASYSDSFNSRLPHSCNICGQTYNNYYNVLRHMEGKHPDQVPKRYMCDKCDAGFPRQGPLRDHMYEVHGTTLPRARREMLSCRMCSEQIDTREKWLQHQTEKHSRYTCCFCTFQTKSQEKFKDHIEAHPQLSVRNNPVPVLVPGNISVTNGENDSCDEEEEEPTRKKIKLEGSIYECPICKSAFNGNVALSNHMRTHYNSDGVKLHLASLADLPKELSTPNMSADASEPIRRIRCHLCSKRFTSKKSYRKHMLNEHEIKNVSFIKCGICKAEFTHERGLRVHLYKTHGTIMTTEDLNAMYECEICDAEFKSEKSLNMHKGMVHKNREKVVPVDVAAATLQNVPTYWHQCSHCSSHFDSNKKLAIHLNSHSEYDAKDYSCRDCGNVYNGRKSLWVHRYKKHREIPNPSDCSMCDKVFYTPKMLSLHMKNHHGLVCEINPVASGASKKVIEKHVKEEREQEEESDDDAENEENDAMEEDDENEEDNTTVLTGKVHCSVCNEEFTDQDLFDKHMEMHQMELYTDNPLAAMFDTGPEDTKPYFKNQMSENGAFTCDICAKTFSAPTALKVHRNWHFRQDAKQIAADPNARSLLLKKKAGHVCEYCDTSFSSASNVRRHIVEVHNRDNFNDPDRAKKFMDKYLECSKCGVKFEDKTEWVKHKIGHAHESFISPFEWGCEICGKIVSRKERLVQHINSHLKKKDRDDGTGSVVSEEQSNSQDTILSGSQGRQSAIGKPRTGEDDDMDMDQIATVDTGSQKNIPGKSDDSSNSQRRNIKEAEESINDVNDDRDSDDEDENENENEDDTDNSEDEKEDLENRSVHYDEDSSQQYQEVDPDQDDIQDEDEEEEENGEEEEDQDNIGAYSCDLCQVYFETAKQLRRHVTSHFLNGPGSVTLTEIPKDKSSFSTKVQNGGEPANSV